MQLCIREHGGENFNLSSVLCTAAVSIYLGAGFMYSLDWLAA